MNIPQRSKQPALLPVIDVAICFSFLLFCNPPRRMGKKQSLSSRTSTYEIRVVFQFNPTLTSQRQRKLLLHTGRVGMSARPDPERSGAVEVATRRRPRLRVVWDLRELTHSLTRHFISVKLEECIL